MKTREQLDAEIAAFLAGREAARGPDRAFVNAPTRGFETITTDRSSATEHRWVGRCKKCKTAHQLNGHLAMARAGKHSFGAIVTRDGVYMQDDNGSNCTKVTIPCYGGGRGTPDAKSGHWCRLQRVFDDGRADSKRTTCGARCLSSTSPSCDCRCRGANHGSGL